MNKYMWLFDENGQPAVIGKAYLDFRGEEIYRLDDIIPPHKEGSTGRIICTRLTPLPEEEREFFPGVLKLKWKEIKP